MVLVRRLPLLIPDFCIFSLNVAQRIHGWRLNCDAISRGFKYLGSQRQNTPVFKAINPLLILSSACLVASQLLSIFLDEGDGVSFGQLTGLSHYMFSMLIATANASTVTILVVFEYYTLRAFVSLSDSRTSQSGLPEIWRIFHVVAAALTFLTGWVAVTAQYANNEGRYRMIFIAFIAVMLALCFLIVLFVLYRYASPVQDAQAVVRRDLQSSTATSSTACVCGFCGLRLDSRDPILRLRLVIFINSALELVAIVSQVTTLVKDATSGHEKFDPLKQSVFWDISLAALVQVFINLLYTWFVWVPMCPRTESAISIWSCACMGKCCSCCVDHFGGGLDRGNGSRTHNSRSIVTDGMDDESQGSSGDVITEFGVGMQPMAMAPSIRKKSSLSSTDDSAHCAGNQDARVRFAVDDDELGGLQEYADFDSEAAAEALEGAAPGNCAVMERELTSVSHDESSVHSTSSYVAME